MSNKFGYEMADDNDEEEDEHGRLRRFDKQQNADVNDNNDDDDDDDDETQMVEVMDDEDDEDDDDDSNSSSTSSSTSITSRKSHKSNDSMTDAAVTKHMDNNNNTDEFVEKQQQQKMLNLIKDTSGFENDLNQQMYGTTSSTSAMMLDDDESSDRKRFQIELEFVQSLANPNYLNFLAQRGYFRNQTFLNYLKYLMYWKEPEYCKYLIYPQCLALLEMLQHEQFLKEIVNAQCSKYVDEQLLLIWLHYKKRHDWIKLDPTKIPDNIEKLIALKSTQHQANDNVKTNDDIKAPLNQLQRTHIDEQQQQQQSQDTSFDRLFAATTLVEMEKF